MFKTLDEETKPEGKINVVKIFSEVEIKKVEIAFDPSKTVEGSFSILT